MNWTNYPDSLSVDELLEKLAADQITDYKEYLLFNAYEFQEKLCAIYEKLKAEDTVVLNLYNPNLDSGNDLLVAMTIDGDYIIEQNKTTLVVPVSLEAAAVEVYPYPAVQFLKAYTNKQITSNILADIID